ncbi:MAG TPA: hypothetical protein VGR21_03680, partial [Cryptosporangiaceae bacterium]|nr:hypothetical protein [Cryptosporangiaceae bacterium]
PERSPNASSPKESPPAGETPTGGNPSLVTPRAGMSNVRPVRWESAKAAGPRAVVLTYWSGVEPCHVLDRVSVQYLRDAVRITLFEGSDPRAGNPVCIDIATQKAVRVELTEPLGGRRVIPGT